MSGLRPSHLPDYVFANDEDQEVISIEKTAEQLTEEAHLRWKQFHYPKWAPYIIRACFLFSLITVVLTLEQNHGKRLWERPVDVQPQNGVFGGWPNDKPRYAACIVGLVSTLFSIVLVPSADKFKFIFFLALLASLLAFISFGLDLHELREVRRNLKDICEGDNSFRANKVFCHHSRYIATVIFDLLAGTFGFTFGSVLFWQAIKGYVSRKLIFNETKGVWERAILLPDQHPSDVFPKAYQRQRKYVLGLTIFTALVFLTLLVLSITQHGVATKDKSNPYRDLPVDQWFATDNQGFRRGSWPSVNFNIRLFACILTLCVTSIFIQYKRTGRFQQLVLLVLLFVSSAIHAVAFAFDLKDFRSVDRHGCARPHAAGYDCVYHRYKATLVLNALCFGFGFVVSTLSLFHLFQQARNPTEKIPGRNYGWWCFGEWKAKKARKFARKALEEN